MDWHELHFSSRHFTHFLTFVSLSINETDPLGQSSRHFPSTKLWIVLAHLVHLFFSEHSAHFSLHFSQVWELLTKNPAGQVTRHFPFNKKELFSHFSQTSFLFLQSLHFESTQGMHNPFSLKNLFWQFLSHESLLTGKTKPAVHSSHFNPLKHLAQFGRQGMHFPSFSNVASGQHSAHL